MLWDEATPPGCFNDMFNSSSNFRHAGEIGVAVEWRILDIFFPFNKRDNLFPQRFIQNSPRVPGGLFEPWVVARPGKSLENIFYCLIHMRSRTKSHVRKSARSVNL